MLNNYILGLGLEAFEDRPGDQLPVPADQVYVEPVSVEEANVLVVDRNVAIEDANVAASESEVISEMARAAIISKEQERVEVLAASMEHFMEVGMSPATAIMLKDQLSDALNANGRTLSAISPGVENFENKEEVEALFSAGLEALNDAKASLGMKLVNAMVNIGQSLNKYFGRVFLKAGRMRDQAEIVIKTANGKTGSTAVSVKNKFLATKTGKASTNLVGDIEGLSKIISLLTDSHMQSLGGYGNGQVLAAMNKMKSVTTVADAKKVVDGLKPPAFPGANVSVKDTPELTLKRTDVVLGGFAVFDLQYKTTGGDTWQEVVNQLKALGKARTTLRRPEEGETSGKVTYEATLTPQDAVKIAQAVIKMADSAMALRKAEKWTGGFMSAVKNHSKGAEFTKEMNMQADKGVITIGYQLAKLPAEMMEGVNQLLLSIPNAIYSVGGAALAVAKKAANGSKGDTE